MIFLGDIAVPSIAHCSLVDSIFSQHQAIFAGQRIVANLEGLISSADHTQSDTPVLFNHPALVPVLVKHNASVLMLANNHALDLPQQFDATARALKSHNIGFTGAGRSASEAATPVNFSDQGKDIWVFNYCWNFLFYHQKNPAQGVFLSDMNEAKILETIRHHKIEYPSSSIVVFFHWSFDLETLPFPMNRLFAQHLIDAGVNVVVGCHSHCVQGGEKYKEGFIVYGLGNFFLPHNIFANAKLSFPKWSNLQLALDWNPATNQALCHWFSYDFADGNHQLKFVATESFETSGTLKMHSPYQNLSAEEYQKLFKVKRRKKMLIPVFTDFRKQNSNAIKLTLLKVRARLARWMARLGLIHWQN